MVWLHSKRDTRLLILAWRISLCDAKPLVSVLHTPPTWRKWPPEGGGGRRRGRADKPLPSKSMWCLELARPSLLCAFLIQIPSLQLGTWKTRQCGITFSICGLRALLLQ